MWPPLQLVALQNMDPHRLFLQVELTNMARSILIIVSILICSNSRIDNFSFKEEVVVGVFKII